MRLRLGHLAAWSTALCLALPGRATLATQVVLALPDYEPQYASQLCWAAADTMAVNSFFPPAPPSMQHCQSGGSPGTISQARDAAYRSLSLSTLPQVAGADPTTLMQHLTDCSTNVQLCNKSGTPPLLGLTFSQGTSATGLGWPDVMAQIDKQHPFLFVWNILSSDGGTEPLGAHQLLAIGYDTSNMKILIWDPWPVPSPLPATATLCGPEPSVSVSIDAHSRWIPYSMYSDPKSDMGVQAVHGSDQYNLAIAETQPVVPMPPTNVTVDGGISSGRHPPPPPTPAPFADALRAAVPAARTAVRLRQNRSLGTAFPIVGIGLADLERARPDLGTLLTGRTTAVLFPVEEDGRVVDSFLMLLDHGRWVREGYSNADITRRLVEVRARYAGEQHLRHSDFYVVSVPGMVAFFAAHGTDARTAVLIPASSDPAIGAVAGRAEPATQQLSRLVATLDRLRQGLPALAIPGRPVP